MSEEVLVITRPEKRFYLAWKDRLYWNLLNRIFMRHKFFQGSSLCSS